MASPTLVRAFQALQGRDPAGLELLVIVALDEEGRLWLHEGSAPWRQLAPAPEEEK